MTKNLENLRTFGAIFDHFLIEYVNEYISVIFAHRSFWLP